VKDTPAEIQRCLDNNGRSFFDFQDLRDRRGSMSGKAQPFIHKFIADTILDFDQDDYASDGFDLFNLFMMLKTTVNTLHEAASRAVLEKTGDCLIGRCPLTNSPFAAVQMRLYTPAADAVASALAFSPYFCDEK
jgi:hypothetical protein